MKQHKSRITDQKIEDQMIKTELDLMSTLGADLDIDISYQGVNHEESFGFLANVDLGETSLMVSSVDKDIKTALIKLKESIIKQVRFSTLRKTHLKGSNRKFNNLKQIAV